MSGDEFFVTIVGILLGPVAWTWWFVSTKSIDDFRPGGRTRRRAILATVIACGLIIQATLVLGAADDVRTAPNYTFMYLVLGLAWISLAAWLFKFLGIHSRD